jgi:hypothetical protein
MRNVLSLSLLCLASWAAITVSADDLLQLVVMGSGGQVGAALAEVTQDASTFLSDFVSAEGSSYKLVQPGGSLPVDRKLQSSSSTEDEPRKLADLGCPNSCSNSGSSKCALLGCAYCGKCGGRRDRRRTRSLQQQLRTASQQRSIESDLQADLDQYCEGRTGCTLHARILRTNADGTATRAN